MKYCFHCKHLNIGKPQYCPYCGHTFNIKLCPRGHINAPNNLICGECGSEDLSESALSPLWIKKVKWGLLFFIVIIIITNIKLIIQFIVLFLLMVFIFIGFMSFISNWLPEPFNKSFNSFWKAIRFLLGSNNRDRRKGNNR